jgi:hypothetical protein
MACGEGLDARVGQQSGLLHVDRAPVWIRRYPQRGFSSKHVTERDLRSHFVCSSAWWTSPAGRGPRGVTARSVRLDWLSS